MSKEIGVVVVGVGFVGGQAHTPSFKKIEGSNLLGLCARSKKRVKPLAEQWEVPYFLDYEEVLKNPDLDAVVLSVPTPLHYQMAMQAIKGGKNVLCEMPIAAKLEQVWELKEAAEKAGVMIMPVLNFRFAPIYVKTKEMIKKGSIGNPIAIHYREFLPAAVLAEQWPASSWAWDKESSGGFPDYTLSVWAIDMLRWMFSEEFVDIEWRSNYTKLEQYGGIYGYNTMGVFKFSNGIVGTFHFGASVGESSSTTRLEVYGDNTDIIHSIMFNKILHYSSDEKPVTLDLVVKGTKVWGHRQIDTHFIDCLLGKEEQKVTIDDAIKAQEIAEKINR